MAKGTGLPIGSIIVLILLVVIGLFLFGKFFAKVGGEWGIKDPVPDTEPIALTVIQLLIVGAMTYVIFQFAPRFGVDMSRSGAVSLVIVAILAFLLYKYVAEPIMSATTLAGIGTSIGSKLGLLP